MFIIITCKTVSKWGEQSLSNLSTVPLHRYSPVPVVNRLSGAEAEDGGEGGVSDGEEEGGKASVCRLWVASEGMVGIDNVREKFMR